MLTLPFIGDEILRALLHCCLIKREKRNYSGTTACSRHTCYQIPLCFVHPGVCVSLSITAKFIDILKDNPDIYIACNQNTTPQCEMEPQILNRKQNGRYRIDVLI